MKSVLRLFRYVKDLEKENRLLRAETAVWERFRPPGHFYSPLPSLEEIQTAYARGNLGEPFEGIDLNEEEQWSRLEAVIAHYAELPYPEKPTAGWRYHLDNPSYGMVDGVMLHGMIRHLRPKRIIEVGSGFSSAAMLDLNEHVLGSAMRLTFVDPDMTRLHNLLAAGEASAMAELIEKPVQEVPASRFAELEANDILFIDSSHVGKVGSDVNHLFFRVLPVLKPGVFVHVHDIASNFEYPRDWLEDGRAWNEQYLLRAFLMYNAAFRIALFPPWLLHHRRDYIVSRMPRCDCAGGGQIWLRRAG